MGGMEIFGTELLGGRYRLVEQLGAGGMSVVWRGYDEVLGRQVAVKVLAAPLAADRSFRHRIRVEAQAAARLCHPQITNVYDYGESIEGDAAVPYVVMELVDGESLSARLGRTGQLPWHEAVSACAEVAAALATAHARGVVHRDVTPGNVMLTPAGAKVVDFGISALVGERDAGPDGSLLGTPAYLAPERLDGGQVAPATDVYALGLLLYRTLTGRLPWQAATSTQMLRAHRYADPTPMPPVDGLPDEVAALCERCLAKEPSARPSSADVARTLAATVGAAAVIPVSPAPTGGTAPLPEFATAGTTILPWPTATEATPESGVGGPRRVARRHRFEAAAVGAGALAVTGLIWGVSTGSSATGGETAVGASTVGMAVQDPAKCAVRYSLRSDSGRGFDANLVLTNNSTEPAADWKLTFTFPGDQILTRGRSAQWEQQGRDVVVHPDAGGGALAPGESTSLGLSGRYGGANPLPVKFELDGANCDVQVSGVAGSGPTKGTPATGKAGDSGPGKSDGPKKDGTGRGQHGDRDDQD